MSLSSKLNILNLPFLNSELALKNYDRAEPTDLREGSRALRYREEGCTARDLEGYEKNCPRKRVTGGSGSDYYRIPAKVLCPIFTGKRLHEVLKVCLPG